jgi:hypothetical protein
MAFNGIIGFLLILTSLVACNRTYEDNVNSTFINVLRRMNTTRLDFIIQFIGVYIGGWENIEGELIRVGATANDSVSFGCSKYGSLSRVEPFIALIDAGVCSIQQKIHFARQSGASGILIRNSQETHGMNRIEYQGKKL